VQHKTVHAAGDTLCLTQTAVTQRIRGLEHRLGTTLFKRTRRGMEPTQEAKALIRYCQSALALEGEALASIQGQAENTTIEISISGPTSIMHARIVPALQKLMSRYPHLLLRFVIDDTETCHKALKNGTCDFAITPPEYISAEMQSKTLQPEAYVLVASKAWEQRSLNEIISTERLIDFNAEDQVTFNYLKHYNLYEQAQYDRHLVNRPEIMAELIKNGLGYGTLTREFASLPELKKALTLLNEGQAYFHPLSLAWYNRPTPPPYFKAIIAALA